MNLTFSLDNLLIIFVLDLIALEDKVSGYNDLRRVVFVYN